eukprot:TRINITY_DN19456_c0_g1_i1.p1 TRINITY_DN19456_c0_g1~~TRINITY_DN19456_c0_g1_i1.p1  ORF type:complete len:265 (-),score=18.39 TRINITY_DN19456_c0_g1_i1:544-1338(-)
MPDKLEDSGATDHHPSQLRRVIHFPILFRDVEDIYCPSIDRFDRDEEGILVPDSHWTFLSEIVHYDPTGLVRPHIRCKDAKSVEVNIHGYFEGRRNIMFDTLIAPNLRPGRVLAMRYARKKTFLDGTEGIRLEDDQVAGVMVLPGSLADVMAAGDNVSLMGSKCWACKISRDGAEPVQLSKCGKCKTALYCSKACQTEDWTSVHKRHCKLIPGILELIGRGRVKFDLAQFHGYEMFNTDEDVQEVLRKQTPTPCGCHGKGGHVH